MRLPKRGRYTLEAACLQAISNPIEPSSTMPQAQVPAPAAQANANPEVQVRGIILTNASLETTPELYDSPRALVYRIHLAPNFVQEKETGHFRVSLRATAEGFEGKDIADIADTAKAVMVAEVTVTGFIAMRNIGPQVFEHVLSVEIPNQLLPNARHHLQQLTLNAGQNPVMLPFVQFHAQVRPVVSGPVQTH